MLDQCSNCPSTCLGLEYSSDCGYITKDISSKGITKGESLTGVLEKLANGITPTVAAATVPSTDDIITNSLVRNPSALCASKIVSRDFEYNLNVGASNSSFSWDLMDIVSELPTGYELGTARVKATGKNNGSGTTVFDSTKLSAAQSIGLDRYPVTVDLNLRIVTDCGNVDMTKKVYLAAPIQQDTNRVFMMVNDLLPGSLEDLSLTTQLDMLETNVQTNTQRIVSFETLSIDGVTQDIKQVVSQHDQSITVLQETLEFPSVFKIDYTKDGLVQTDTITDVVDDLYDTIKAMQQTIEQQAANITTLQAQVASLL